MNKTLLISGSLRKQSINTKLLQDFAGIMSETHDVAWADLNLPLYNEDIETDFPGSAKKLKDQILDADIIIISTPEYNRAMSGALKNALDWASRPGGDNSWVGKRVFVTSASPGGIGGALALYQVKQSLLHLKAEVISEPEFIVGGAYDKFDSHGHLTDDKTRQFIRESVEKITA